MGIENVKSKNMKIEYLAFDLAFMTFMAFMPLHYLSSLMKPF